MQWTPFELFNVNISGEEAWSGHCSGKHCWSLSGILHEDNTLVEDSSFSLLTEYMNVLLEFLPESERTLQR